jgi:hypothetical protein
MKMTGLVAKRLLLPPTPEQISFTGLLATWLGIVSVLRLFLAGGVLFYFVDKGEVIAQSAERNSG